MKKVLAALCGLVLILICIFFLERAPRFSSSKQLVQSQLVPPGVLTYGTLGDILKQMNVVCPVSRDPSHYPPSLTSMSASRLSLRQRPLLLQQYQFRANPGRMQSLPSSLAISERDFKDGWPLLSIYADDKSLYDSEKGILTHRTNRGQDWERLAYASYYEDGQLVFASGIGLRIHGGDQFRRWWTGTSFRMYFRNVYGIDHIEPGVLYGLESKPIKHLVVVGDRPRKIPFISCVAYEIARRIGATVPESKPVLLFLNGKLLGTYALLEHVHERQWEYHLGRDNFAFFSLKGGKSDERSQKLYEEFSIWARDLNRAMTLEEAEKYVDLNNLSRQVISIAFCGTTDWRQSAAVLDFNQPAPKWFWVNWDLNHSFIDYRRKMGWLKGNPRKAWEQEGFELVLTGKNWYLKNERIRRMRRWDVRSVLFSRLVKESPEYCEYFVRLTMDILNHQLTTDFFQPQIERYKQLAISYGFEKRAYAWIERYVKNRPAFIREQIQQLFGEGDCFKCEVSGPRGIQYEIDGYPESSGYQGWYFGGKKITVRIRGLNRRVFSHWLVNGKKIEETSLEHKVLSKTRIRPMFKSQDKF